MTMKDVGEAVLGEELWVDKYRPASLKQLIGQQGDKSNAKKLITWLQDWQRNHGASSNDKKKVAAKPPPWGAANDTGAWAKAALLSGPPGVGKTTTAYLACRELGFDVVELNASDTRSKRLLQQNLADAVDSKSLAKESDKRVLLMDEVDGMAGNEDRGGMAELILLIKSSKIPVVCMCNDRNSQKIRSLANHCFDLRFQRPRAEQIKAAMMSICFKEKVKIAPDALTDLIVSCNQDIRQVIHHLSLLKGGVASEKNKDEKTSNKTSLKIGPFDVVRKVFSAGEQKDMSLADKSDLFFQDYSAGPLFAHENYLSVTPAAAEKNPKKVMELVSRTADSFCNGDVVDRAIRSRQAWSLLPTQAIYSSVIPGEYMSGYMSGQIQFPAWFGKNSRQTKCDRLLQELQTHTRLAAGLSKQSLNQEYLQHLRNAILRPMLTSPGKDGVDESVQMMKLYALLREDLDGLLELSQWPGGKDLMKDIPTAVKSAFTRQYNKEVVLPYSTNLGAVGRKRSAAAASLGEGDDDMGEDGLEADDDMDEDNIESDTMIKAKKPAVKKPDTVIIANGKESAKGKGKKPKK